MGKDRGHIPVRTCIACRKKMPKTDLDRIVLDPEGRPVFDRLKRAAGRGVYVCRNPVCRKILGKRAGLRKALRIASPVMPLPHFPHFLMGTVGTDDGR